VVLATVRKPSETEARLASTLERIEHGLPPFTASQQVNGEAGGGSDPPPGSQAASVATTQAEATRPAESRRSFLSFVLPADGFAFDQVQRFEIVPSLSRVGFDAKSTLHDFTGVTSAVRGSLVARLSDLSADASARIEADAASLDTGLADRNEAMREHLAPHTHPKILFELKTLESKGIDAVGKKMEGVVKGELTVRGVTRPISMPLKVVVDESMRLVVEGESPLKLSDFGVPVPSKLGLISMQDEVRIWISLRARVAGRVKP
jgi:polyisoprenoid-binding protein YceI